MSVAVVKLGSSIVADDTGAVRLDTLQRLCAQTASGRVREQVICHAAGYTERVATTARETVRLGGMALRNGIFVHSLDHWAAAVRTPDGELRLASGRKPELPAGLLAVPGVRGVLRMAEMGYLLPIMRRRLPEARLPVEGAGSAAALGATVVVSRAIRGSRLSPLTAELLGASLALVPAMASLRGSQVAGYHGAEHKAIGGYEHGQAAQQATKEHDRCEIGRASCRERV